MSNETNIYDPYDCLCPICGGMPEIFTCNTHGEISGVLRVACSDCFARTWGTKDYYPATKDYYFTMRNKVDTAGYLIAVQEAVKEWRYVTSKTKGPANETD